MDKEELKAVVTETLGEYLEKNLEEAVSEKTLEVFKKLQNESAKGEKDSYGVSVKAKETFADSFKALMSGEIKELKTVINEGTDSEGGYTIPVELFNGIIRLAGEYGAIAKFATKYPSGTKSLEIVRNSQGALMGSIVGGTESTNETDVTFSLVDYTKETWQVILGLTRQVKKYEAVGLANFLMALIAEGFSARLEQQAIAGDGVGRNFTGMLVDSSVPTYATGKAHVENLTVQDFTKGMAVVPKSARRDAIVFTHSSVFAEIQGIMDGDSSLLGRGLATADRGNDSGLKRDGTLIGRDVYTSDFMPDLTTANAGGVFAIFGSLSKGLGWTADSETAEIVESNDATVNTVSAFASRITFYRANIEFAVGVAEPKALVKWTVTG